MSPKTCRCASRSGWTSWGCEPAFAIGGCQRCIPLALFRSADRGHDGAADRASRDAPRATESRMGSDQHQAGPLQQGAYRGIRAQGVPVKSERPPRFPEAERRSSIPDPFVPTLFDSLLFRQVGPTALRGSPVPLVRLFPRFRSGFTHGQLRPLAHVDDDSCRRERPSTSPSSAPTVSTTRRPRSWPTSAPLSDAREGRSLRCRIAPESWILARVRYEV